MSDGNRTRNWKLIFLSVASLWALIVGIVLLQTWPNWPKNNLQWWLLIGLGPPFYLVCEAIGSWLFSPAHGRAISKRTFSGVRITVALVAMLCIFALAWWVSWLVETSQ
jgi:hypothetical protein